MIKLETKRNGYTQYLVPPTSSATKFYQKNIKRTPLTLISIYLFEDKVEFELYEEHEYGCFTTILHNIDPNMSIPEAERLLLSKING